MTTMADLRELAIINNSEIEHHGVKGMRWGVRKEDPSTTDVKSREARLADRRNRRANKYDTAAKMSQTKIDELKVKLPDAGRFKSRKIKNQVSDLQKERDYNQTQADRIREGKLTRNQKIAIAGAAFVAAYATYKFVDSGQATRLKTIGESFIKGQDPTKFKENPLLADKNLGINGIRGLVVSRINPDYGDLGTKANCRRCTFAYELSRRGYDVKATKSVASTGQTMVGVHNAVTPGSKNSTNVVTSLIRSVTGDTSLHQMLEESADSGGLGKQAIDMVGNKSEAIFKELGKMPNGSRGELGVKWQMGGGHSMAWEIVKGTPVIFDTQNGDAYSSVESFELLADKAKLAGITRLDNLPLNYDFLLKWVQNND